jgi:hypothetical protein
MALMSGKLRSPREAWRLFLPYASAAKELLELAGRVPTAFPESLAGDPRVRTRSASTGARPRPYLCWRGGLLPALASPDNQDPPWP